MISKNRWFNILPHWIGILLIFGFAVPAFSEPLPSKGSVLPDLQLTSPVSEADRAYLGIGNAESFTLDQVKGRIFVIEVVGVYCPQCHTQFPRNNKLFKMIAQNENMRESVKMFAIAAGATSMEAEFLVKQAKIPYPVLEDPKFENHKLLGEPKTPFTMIVRNNGVVEYVHLGTFDIDEFFSSLKQLVR